MTVDTIRQEWERQPVTAGWRIRLEWRVSLVRDRYPTFGHLAWVTRDDLLAIPGVGAETVDCVMQRLSRLKDTCTSHRGRDDGRRQDLRIAFKDPSLIAPRCLTNPGIGLGDDVKLYWQKRRAAADCGAVSGYLGFGS